MEYLLSGLIGAIIASILSIVYQSIIERLHLRKEIMLEVVSYFDDIYTRLQALHLDKSASIQNKKRGLSDEEYRIFSRELKNLLISSKIGVKLYITYGKSDIMAMFNCLSDLCLETARLLWKTNESNLVENEKIIFNLFEEKIDPLRKDFQDKLIKNTCVIAIINCWINNFLDFPKVITQNGRED